jgi:hypothetical protein
LGFGPHRAALNRRLALYQSLWNAAAWDQSGALPNTIRRYGRLKICATIQPSPHGKQIRRGGLRSDAAPQFKPSLRLGLLRIVFTVSNLELVIGRGKLPPRNKPLPPEMRQAIADYVATNQAALELLEKGLALKSCRYPVDLTPGWDALLPHLAGLKKSAPLLALKTLLGIESGETGEAAESLQRMMTLADTVAKEPLLVSHLVRIS